MQVMINKAVNSTIVHNACNFIKDQALAVSNNQPIHIFLVKFNLITKISLKIYGLDFILKLINDVQHQILELTQDKNSKACFLSIDSFLITSAVNNQHDIFSKKIITLIESLKFSKDNPIHLSVTISSYEVKDAKIDPILAFEDLMNAIAETDPKKNILIKHHVKTSSETKSTLKDTITQGNYLKCKIESKNVTFVYQPVFNIKENKIEYYECLMRIIDNNCLNSAGLYISAAEELYLSPVIDEAAVDLIEQSLKKFPECKFSFNLTAGVIDNKPLTHKLKKLFSNQSYAKRVHIEITETSKLSSVEATIEFMKMFKKLNLKFALDDFGVGYTNFDQLKHLPINVIKIDGSFIKDIVSSHVSQCFVKSIVDITKNTDIIVVAEYVENKEIKNLLEKMNINLMQGYFFGQPMETPLLP